MDIFSCLGSVSGKLRSLRADIERGIVTACLLALAAGVIVCASGFLLAAAYMSLATQMSGPEAALCVAGGLVLLSALIFVIATSRRQSGRQSGRQRSGGAAQALPAQTSEPAQQAQELADVAVNELINKVRSAPTTAAVTAMALGVVIGLLRPKDGD